MFPIGNHEDRTVRPLEQVLGETGPEYPFEPLTPLAAGDDQTRVDLAGEPEHFFLRVPFSVTDSQTTALG